VTFTAFETYVDYKGSYGSRRDPLDPRHGELEFSVEWSNFVPDSVDAMGSFYARPDGLLELRDLWRGPDAAQCGHVFERFQ